jgi:hypothetical protein
MGQVTTWVGVVGLVVSVAGAAITSAVRARNRLMIEAVKSGNPEAARVVSDAVSMFRLNVANLAKAQVQQLALTELQLRDRRDFRRFMLLCLLIVASATTVIVGLLSQHLAANPGPAAGPPPLAPPIVSAATQVDPCVEMEKRIEASNGRTQSTSLSVLLGDGGTQSEIAVEEPFRTSYQQFGPDTEACRLLHVSIQCADKRSAGSALALKLAEAGPAICRPLPAAPPQASAQVRAATTGAGSAVNPQGKCRPGTTKTQSSEDNTWHSGGECAGHDPGPAAASHFAESLRKDRSYCVPFSPSPNFNCCCVLQ